MEPWNRLQKVAIEHGRRTMKPQKHGRRRFVIPPEELSETCAILGRGDDEEMKARVIWYQNVLLSIWAASFED